MTGSIPNFFGHFHPVLVHLPIGILMLACCFQFFVKKYNVLQPAIPVMVFWGAIFAVFSCVTGYMLSLSGDYDKQTVEQHQWMGIATAGLALAYYLLYKYSSSTKLITVFASITFLLIVVTGHLGGSLTHGADYLTTGLGSNTIEASKPIPNIQEAVLYTDVITPILQRKCYSCHGSNKQKGKLRLDAENFILKGGEDGKIFEAGKADESMLIKRLLLPVTDKEHMAPKEKPQLTKNEIAILHWWISTGADFKKKVKELPQTDKIKPVLAALQSGTNTDNVQNEITDIPKEQVGKADDEAIKKLTDAGVVVIPVARDNNYLSVNFVTARAGAEKLLDLLAPLSKQIVWLKMDGADISDASLAKIANLSALTRLSLSNTKITDQGVAKLQSLKQLQSLNLVGTKVTEKGIVQLKGITTLKELYLYQTAINKALFLELKRTFPKAQIDTGGYNVPTLQTDTTKVTLEQKK